MSAPALKQATCHYSTFSYSSLRWVADCRMPAPAAKKVNVATKKLRSRNLSVAASALVGGFRNTSSTSANKQKTPVMQTAASSRRQLRHSSWTCQLGTPNGRVFFQQIEKACTLCRRTTLNTSISRRIARADKSIELLRRRDNVR